MEKINPQIYRDAYKWQFEAYPFYTSVYNRAAERARRKYFTSFDRFISYFHDGQLYAFVSRTRINRTGNRIIKELINGNGVFIVHFEKVYNEMREAIRLCFKARESGDYADLEKWWPATQKALSDVCNILFNFDFPLDNFLIKLQKKSEREFNELKNAICADKPSFIDEAKNELIKLNKKYPRDFNKIHQEFLKKFGWFQNSYKGRFEIDKKWLKIYSNSVKTEKHIRTGKKPAKAAQKFGLLAEAASFGITFRDDKKKLLLVAVDLMEVWLKDVCKQKKWKYEEIRWLSMDEILSALAGKRRSYYLAKARACALSDCRYGMMAPFGYGDIAPEFWRKVFALNSPGAASGEIKGVPANKGKLRGVVKVIINPKAAGHFQDGDILVTSMTRPEFLTLMKKASAFITDEGGITCHAAIMSRELKTPCIIGTKIATKVLKDGDLVEVDANRGVVKILKQ